MVELEPDCARCVGLCCVALPFRESHGFAFAKDAGEPCRHLGAGYGCSIHAVLRESGMSGCTTYECFGAGQHVTQAVYDGRSWRDQADGGEEMFAVFAVVQRLHEMLVLLDQAALLSPDADTATDVAELRARVEEQRRGHPDELLDVELDRLAARVGELLRRVSRSVREPGGEAWAGADLAGRDLRSTTLADADLRGALLLAADLRGAALTRTDLLGSDLRDADVSGADLSASLFLTQPQLNAARGSATTVLPAGLRRPLAWLL